MNSKGNGLKKISIRILFPLIFSGAVTACVIALILFFSDYFWDRIYDNARTDMERQLESFSYNVESEIYHMIDLVNETCYICNLPDAGCASTWCRSTNECAGGFRCKLGMEI